MKTEMQHRYLQGWLGLNDRDYLLHTIAYQAAPVLEQQKPGVILTFTDDRRRELYSRWREEQHAIPQSEDFCHFILQESSSHAVVLFYSPRLLQQVLEQRASSWFLESCGYQKQPTLPTALADLKERYQAGCPHEIGLFLGIPLPDVLGFIRHGGKQALADGYWKVYHDPERKQALFAKYHEAKLGFVRQMLAGAQPSAYLQERVSPCFG